ATSLDGRIAAGSGVSRWMTGPVARRRVHEMRRLSDAILCGIGTVLADDPRLTVRLPGGWSGRGPLRCVLDPTLRLPLSSRLLGPVEEGEAGGPVVVYARSGASQDASLAARMTAVQEAGGEVVEILPEAGDGDERLDLTRVLE